MGLNGAKLRPDGMLDMNTLSSPFIIRRIVAAAEPTLEEGELAIWYDSENDQIWLYLNDPTGGMVRVELTTAGVPE